MCSCSLLDFDVCFPTHLRLGLPSICYSVVSFVVNVVTYYVSYLTFIFWVKFHTLCVSYKRCVPAVLLEVLRTCMQ